MIINVRFQYKADIDQSLHFRKINEGPSPPHIVPSRGMILRLFEHGCSNKRNQNPKRILMTKIDWIPAQDRYDNNLVGLIILATN